MISKDGRKGGSSIGTGQLLSLEHLRKFVVVTTKPRIGLRLAVPYDLDGRRLAERVPPAVISPSAGAVVEES